MLSKSKLKSWKWYQNLNDSIALSETSDSKHIMEKFCP